MKNKSKNKFQNEKNGFTLVETLFGISIFVLVLGLITLFSRNVWVYNSFISSELASVDAGRQILKTMVSEIRTASDADTGAYTINQATASSFIFYSDMDNDDLKERVRYFLTGTTLQKGVIKPTGSPLVYNSGSEIISTLSENVTNSLIFDYYDKNYDGTTSPLPSPVSIPAIRLVKITLTTDKDPNIPPAPNTLSTQVSIRNLKDN